MDRDEERVGWLVEGMGAEGLDALICGLPPNVLMLCGYWPIVGQSLAVATSEGKVGILAPADEEEFARTSWADEIEVFEPSATGAPKDITEILSQPFGRLAAKLNLHGKRIGFESRSAQIPSPYASVHVFNDDLRRLLQQSLPLSDLVDLELLLMRLASRKSAFEIDKITVACEIAEKALERAPSKYKRV